MGVSPLMYADRAKGPLKIAAVISDVDGTIVEYETIRSPTSFPAAYKSVTSFVDVCIATGRSLESMKSLISNSPLEDANIKLFPGIYNDGLTIYGESEDEILLKKQFDHELLRELLQFLTPMEATVVLQTRSGVVSNKRSPDFDFWIGYTSEKFTVDPDLLQYCKPDFEVVYCLVLSESQQVMESLLQEIQKGNFRDKVYARMSGTRHTHLAPTNCDKLDAIKLLSKRFGWDRKDIVAIGDGCNDVTALGWVGHSIAVEGGDTEAMRVAKMVTRPPREGGWAHALLTLVAASELVADVSTTDESGSISSI